MKNFFLQNTCFRIKWKKWTLGKWCTHNLYHSSAKKPHTHWNFSVLFA